MTDLALSARRYLWVDRLTKLGGLVCVAIALEVGAGGIGTALAAVGVALALATIAITTENS